MSTAVLAAAPDPGTGIGQVAGLFGQALLASGFREGCPVATVALDASAGSEAIRMSCEGAYGSWADALERHFRDHAAARADPPHPPTLLLPSFHSTLRLPPRH